MSVWNSKAVLGYTPKGWIKIVECYLNGGVPRSVETQKWNSFQLFHTSTLTHFQHTAHMACECLFSLRRHERAWQDEIGIFTSKSFPVQPELHLLQVSILHHTSQGSLALYEQLSPLRACLRCLSSVSFRLLLCMLSDSRSIFRPVCLVRQASPLK